MSGKLHFANVGEEGSRKRQKVRMGEGLEEGFDHSDRLPGQDANCAQNSPDPSHSPKERKAKLNVDEKATRLLQCLGYTDYRPPQKEVVMTLAGGNNAMVIMPTGGGKSLCYQLPSFLRKGIGIVISPLIALMQDQTESLISKGVPAASLTSANSAAKNREVYDDLGQKKPRTKILYITPELAITSKFMAILNDLYVRKKMALLAVDEAHCISSWGHDFRPSYRKLTKLREAFPQVPCIAATATATPTVRKDIIKLLNLEDAKLYMRSFNRPNIHYAVKYKDLMEDPALDLIQFLRTNVETGAAIVYVHKRATADSLAARLKTGGIHSSPYHAGLKDGLRSEILTKWLRGDFKVVVATIAFGMGIDKSSVRAVVHWNAPKSLEGFYQESGRAGRDGQQSYSLMYYSLADRSLFEFLISKNTKSDGVRERKALAEVAKYAESTACRRKTILNHFGEKVPDNLCGQTCDFCENPTSVTLALGQLGKFGMFKNINKGKRSFAGERTKGFAGGKGFLDGGEESISDFSSDEEFSELLTPSAGVDLTHRKVTDASISQSLAALEAAERQAASGRTNRLSGNASVASSSVSAGGYQQRRSNKSLKSSSRARLMAKLNNSYDNTTGGARGRGARWNKDRW